MPTPDHDSGDLLRPDRFLSSSSLRRSRSSWQTLLSSAQSAATLPYPCVNVKALLNKTPSIPQSPEAAECAWPNSLFIEGYSKWTISRSNHACHLPPTKQMLPRDVCIGDSQPGTCNLSEDYIPQWIGFQSPSRPVGNYLCVFVLGWSYILSARLIELRRTTTEDKVVYTDNDAQLDRHDEGDHFDLDIGSDDAAEVGWWAAILADGCGWQATLARDGKVYYPPWECHLNGSPFRLCHHAQMPSSISSLEPASSAKAHEYLFNLARFHDAFDQVISALAAAITLPGHNRFGAPITLPQATRGRNGSRQNTERIYANEIPTSAEIPHFMAFSATSGLVATCLFGCFWEPGIPCNLVSQWLNPPMREIFPPFIQAKESYTVVGAMSQRRPNVAALWLGSAITGLLPRIFQFQVNRSMLPTTCLEAATWTASPHSFMDPRYYRPAPVERIDGLNVIPREDEFRLMFVTDVLSQTYRNPPLSPYPPFGHVDIENTSLDVRLHLSCNHQPVYHSWNWKCRNGQVLSDFGIPCKPNAETPEPKASLRQSMWMMARITCTRLHKRWVGVCTRLQKPYAYTGLFSMYSWLKGVFSTASSIACRKAPQPDEGSDEGIFDDILSELATRNLFSWTFFAEGIRVHEKPLWNHEWLGFMLDDSEDGADSTECSSPIPKDEENGQKFDRIQRWQGDVASCIAKEGLSERTTGGLRSPWSNLPSSG